MEEKTTLAGLTKNKADAIAATCIEQLRVSRQNKAQRLAQIRESEDLYFGVVKPSVRNPFNESFPYMSGFIDHLMASIDEPPRGEYNHRHLEDYKIAKKYTALAEQESTSNMPHASWAKKDRWVKKFAAFSGLGVYLFYTESYPEYKNCLEAVDYYDFHFEPGGGGDLEKHLFCGQEPIFKTREDLEVGANEGYYDLEQVRELITNTSQNAHKDNQDTAEDKKNRHRAFGLDPISNNYTGQVVFKLVQWITTYEGIRYYVLFDELAQKWVRIKPWKEICSSGLYPYIVWQTHEEASMLMAKAPADDARPIAKIMNRLLNQELYNREKINMGQRLFDPEMIEDVESLVDNRPDALIPVNTRGGTRPLERALKRVETGTLGGTLDLVQYLNNFAGEKLGQSQSTMGNADKNKTATVFLGEIKQQEKRLGLYNRSYKEAWSQIYLRLAQNGKDHITRPVSIQLLGVDGLEDAEITPEEATKNIEFDVKITGGSDEKEKEMLQNARKSEAIKMLETVNPRWKDEEIMKIFGWNDSDRKSAFNPLPPATMDLLSEAEQAIKEICLGRTPKINQGANLAFAQHINQRATDLDVPDEVKIRIFDYSIAHGQIIAQNEARNAMALAAEKGLEIQDPATAGTGLGPNGVDLMREEAPINNAPIA